MLNQQRPQLVLERMLCMMFRLPAYILRHRLRIRLTHTESRVSLLPREAPILHRACFVQPFRRERLQRLHRFRNRDRRRNRQKYVHVILNSANFMNRNPVVLTDSPDVVPNPRLHFRQQQRPSPLRTEDDVHSNRGERVTHIASARLAPYLRHSDRSNAASPRAGALGYQRTSLRDCNAAGGSVIRKVLLLLRYLGLLVRDAPNRESGISAVGAHAGSPGRQSWVSTSFHGSESCRDGTLNLRYISRHQYPRYGGLAFPEIMVKTNELGNVLAQPERSRRKELSASTPPVATRLIKHTVPEPLTGRDVNDGVAY
jgi:hypothetical protein